MKWLGMFLILISSTAIGFLYARRYAERPLQLRHLQAAFELLETDVTFRMERLSDSFRRIGRTVPPPIGMLFVRAAVELERETARLRNVAGPRRCKRPGRKRRSRKKNWTFWFSSAIPWAVRIGTVKSNTFEPSSATCRWKRRWPGTSRPNTKK